ncbi:hypothetical protein [Mesorhizobium sp. ES1-4]|uniref:hypothetical protein n=1 Tax=Mesorhizobium sp. ES1-4 TaxID=2876627 RepID=UPI001CC9900F|nr:hypothetical protein [Mesorhizobium sp. ES1-4]MBZ9797622.1 hypothetical protein [Mesorhizobium sp. ES1-4]
MSGPEFRQDSLERYYACLQQRDRQREFQKHQGRTVGHFAISTTFARSSSVISVPTPMTREISQIAKATTIEMIVTIQKGRR